MSLDQVQAADRLEPLPLDRLDLVSFDQRRFRIRCFVLGLITDKLEQRLKLVLDVIDASFSRHLSRGFGYGKEGWRQR